jgi:hypothetical protein
LPRSPSFYPVLCRDEPAQEFVEVTTGVKIAQVAVGQDVYILDLSSNIYKYLGNGESWDLSWILTTSL